MLDYLGVPKASAKPSDKMHSPVLQSDFHKLRHCRFDCRSKHLAAGAIKRPHAAQVSGEMAMRHEGFYGFVNHNCRRRKSGGRNARETFGDSPRYDEISKSQPGKEHLAEGADVKNASTSIQAFERRRRKTAMMELAVVIVLDDPGALAIAQSSNASLRSIGNVIPRGN